MLHPGSSMRFSKISSTRKGSSDKFRYSQLIDQNNGPEHLQSSIAKTVLCWNAMSKNNNLQDSAV